MDVEPVVNNGAETSPEQNGQNGDAPESDQTPQQKDELLQQEQEDLPQRVAYLEKRVRECNDEIMCHKGTLADVMRRLGQLEAASKSQNSILPSKPFTKSPRREPSGRERPRSMISEGPSTPRPTPRGASASQVGKKWGSMSNKIDETNGHKSPRHGSQLSQAKRSTSHGSLQIKSTTSLTKGSKDSSYNEENKYMRMYLGRSVVPLYAPSNTSDYNIAEKQELPAEKLALEWCYGYRGRDTRSNLYYLPTGEALYFMASVIVLENFEEHTQRHYLEHTDDIKCIAIHPDKIRVASGQVAGHDKHQGKNPSAVKKPHVRIWDSMTLHTLHVFGEGEFQRGVCCVNFSKTDKGSMLLAVDESNDHTLSVWNLNSKEPTKIAECKASGDVVLQCEFNPMEEDSIVLCGKNNISFWTLQKRSLNKKMGIFGKVDKPSVMVCFAFASNGDVISGDQNGTLYIWPKGSNKLDNAIQGAHDGGIFSLCVPDEIGTFLSGGKDRKIYQWNEKYEKTGVEAEIPEQYGAVRMITQAKGTMLYVGTLRNCILQGNMEMNFTQVMVEGHRGELWGMDTHPARPQFLTCAYDKAIYLWDSQLHRAVWSKELKYTAHCCCIHPDDAVGIAVIGCQAPKFLVLNLNTHETVGVYTDGNEQVECIQFSPDGKKLAVGNRDNCIYVYEVSEDGLKYHKIGKCSGHSSFVTHIDWAEKDEADPDKEIFRTNSGDYEVLYWNARKCKQETDKDEVRDLKWATNYCTLSWASLGIWPDHADGTDINNCAVSHNGQLMASADDFGKVSLLKYPCDHPKAPAHSYQGHSSHVTQTKFICDDSRLISTGGNDCAILQWKIE